MSTIEDKKQALALVLEKLDKTYGKGTVMTLGDASVDTSIEVIPSGSLGLDLALGVNAAPESITTISTAPERIKLSAISKACSALSG